MPKVGVKDRQTGKVHYVNWTRPTKPTYEDLMQMVGQEEGQRPRVLGSEDPPAPARMSQPNDGRSLFSKITDTMWGGEGSVLPPVRGVTRPALPEIPKDRGTWLDQFAYNEIVRPSSSLVGAASDIATGKVVGAVAKPIIGGARKLFSRLGGGRESQAAQIAPPRRTPALLPENVESPSRFLSGPQGVADVRQRYPVDIGPSIRSVPEAGSAAAQRQLPVTVRPSEVEGLVDLPPDIAAAYSPFGRPARVVSDLDVANERWLPSHYQARPTGPGPTEASVRPGPVTREYVGRPAVGRRHPQRIQRDVGPEQRALPDIPQVARPNLATPDVPHPAALGGRSGKLPSVFKGAIEANAPGGKETLTRIQKVGNLIADAQRGAMLTGAAIPKSAFGAASGLATEMFERAMTQSPAKTARDFKNVLKSIPGGLKRAGKAAMGEQDILESERHLAPPGIFSKPAIRAMATIDAPFREALESLGLSYDDALRKVLNAVPKSEAGKDFLGFLKRHPVIKNIFAPVGATTTTNIIEQGLLRTPGANLFKAVRALDPEASTAKRVVRETTGAGAIAAGVKTREELGDENYIAKGFLTAMAGPYAMPMILGLAISDPKDVGKSIDNIARTLSREMPFRIPFKSGVKSEVEQRFTPAVYRQTRPQKRKGRQRAKPQ